MKAIGQFLHHWWINRPDQWHPILGVYYLTYACAFRCRHCSDGFGRPYYQLPSPTLPVSQAIELLKHIRRHCDYLVLTGGEPLQHPDCIEVLYALPSLRFRSVTLTTNGLDLERHLPGIAQAVQVLVCSLQTLHSRKADQWYGVNPGTHERILRNIENAADLPGRSFEMVISSVVTTGNIDDLYHVYEFAQARGFTLAACPQLVGVTAPAQLTRKPEYGRFFDFLISEKKRGGRIHGTVDYLEYMRDLKKFSCRPFTMLVVSPTGNVFYPCLEIGHSAGNLLASSDLHQMRRDGCRRFGPQPDCGVQCHSACALGFSRALANPASILHEALLGMRSWLRSGR